jgi:signal transduction histidine kinase
MKEYYNLITILYVEDEDDIREETSYVLNKIANKLYTASNGKDGLELYKQYKPDLVISDIRMPIMDGLEMSKEIKNINRRQPIIITTAFNDDEYFLKSIELQLNNYILKPVDKKILKEKIKDIIKNILLKREVEKRKVEMINMHKMASLGEMAGNIAHQWRQPLNTISAINMRILTMLEIGEEITLESYRPLSDKINQQLQYLSNTIDIFANFSKTNSQPKDVVIQDLLDKIIDLVDASLKQNGIKLITDIDYSIPRNVTINVNEFNQALLNIIDNSKDSLLKSDKNEKWVKISLSSDDKTTITIEDNGVGIHETIINFILDPYFTTHHKEKGKGLGLYISYKTITEYLNGSLDIKNTQDGAIATIEF